MRPRVAVVGAGSFGRNHLRVVHQSGQAELSGVLDANPQRAAEAAQQFGCRIFRSLEEAAENSDAAVVATPTTTHADVGCRLLDLGLDVLVEKPIAHSPEAGARLVETASPGSMPPLPAGFAERHTKDTAGSARDQDQCAC